MYGATRERAPSSTRLAGVVTAATMTVAFGYAMANGMGAYIAQQLPETLIYVPLPDKAVADTLPPPTSDLPLSADAHDVVAPLRETTNYTYDEDTLIGTTPVNNDRVVGSPIPLPPQPSMVRTRASLIPGAKPTYPPTEIRKNSEGLTSLEVCIDARGRVTAASLANSSGHPGLDDAALKWVRNAKFTPAKLNGEPQSTCGHTVAYEWKLDHR